MLRDIDITVYNDEAIAWAVENGQIEIIKLLLEDKRADPRNFINSIPIVIANKRGHTEAVRLVEDYSRKLTNNGVSCRRYTSML